jgi:Na+/melibiose symporter-like transporter
MLVSRFIAIDLFLAYLVELFPFAERTRGIACFQFFGRGAGFFTTFVNPIGLSKATWKYMIMYCVWILLELVIIYFFFPETHNRTLEELSFSKILLLRTDLVGTDNWLVFESQELKDKQTTAVEKRLQLDEEESVQQNVVLRNSNAAGEKETDTIVTRV